MHTITIITCTINCMLSISCKSSTIFSSSDILIINNGGNVLLIELLMFIDINVLSMVFYKQYDQCYHKYNVACKGYIGKYD